MNTTLWNSLKYFSVLHCVLCLCHVLGCIGLCRYFKFGKELHCLGRMWTTWINFLFKSCSVALHLPHHDNHLENWDTDQSLPIVPKALEVFLGHKTDTDLSQGLLDDSLGLFVKLCILKIDNLFQISLVSNENCSYNCDCNNFKCWTPVNGGLCNWMYHLFHTNWTMHNKSQFVNEYLTTLAC